MTKTPAIFRFSVFTAEGELKFHGSYRRGVGFSMPLPERSDERLQVEGNVLYLIDECEFGARSVDLECGLRVAVRER